MQVVKRKAQFHLGHPKIMSWDFIVPFTFELLNADVEFRFIPIMRCPFPPCRVAGMSRVLGGEVWGANQQQLGTADVAIKAISPDLGTGLNLFKGQLTGEVVGCWDAPADSPRQMARSDGWDAEIPKDWILYVEIGDCFGSGPSGNGMESAMFTLYLERLDME